ncbi:Protein kinase domain-containing protein [Psidium guajava]|nr:Protein kinase domain-containing protein [Psidium guajava]
MAACWSSENATKAYLRALKMGKRGKEPDSAEFISALAAGNNAQLMVMMSSPRAVEDNASRMLALVAAAHQTGGRVVHVSPPGQDESTASRDLLGPRARGVEFLVGEPRTLLSNELRGADFVLLDCKGDDPRGIFEAAQEGAGGGIIVGYNALHKCTLWNGLRVHFLPIGEGLMVARIVKDANTGSKIGHGSGGRYRKKSRWVVTVDDCTGEEHVFRIVLPRGKEIEA